MYSPALGRFLQPDTIGYAGGNNLYAYVGNDPLDRVDPSGQIGVQFSVGETGYVGTGNAGAFGLPFVATVHGGYETVAGTYGQFYDLSGNLGTNSGFSATYGAGANGYTAWSGNWSANTISPDRNWELGVAFDLGKNLTFTTANNVQDTTGLFNNWQADLGVLSITFSSGQNVQGSSIYSMSVGAAVGFGFAHYQTDTAAPTLSEVDNFLTDWLVPTSNFDTNELGSLPNLTAK